MLRTFFIKTNISCIAQKKPLIPIKKFTASTNISSSQPKKQMIGYINEM